MTFFTSGTGSGGIVPLTNTSITCLSAQSFLGGEGAVLP